MYCSIFFFQLVTFHLNLPHPVSLALLPLQPFNEGPGQNFGKKGENSSIIYIKLEQNHIAS